MNIINLLNAEYLVSILLIVCIVAMVFNKKINIAGIFQLQFKIFKNNKTKKVSILDILSFIICPVVLSLTICLWYGFIIDKELAQILTTAFSLIFTLLFAFQAILVSKKDSNNKVEREVIHQTFVSIVTASIYSLVIIVLSVILMFVSNCTAVKVLTILVLTLSFMTIMLLLMIIKRTFKVYIHDDNQSSNNK